MPYVLTNGALVWTPPEPLPHGVGGDTLVVTTEEDYAELDPPDPDTYYFLTA